MLSRSTTLSDAMLPVIYIFWLSNVFKCSNVKHVRVRNSEGIILPFSLLLMSIDSLITSKGTQDFVLHVLSLSTMSLPSSTWYLLSWDTKYRSMDGTFLQQGFVFNIVVRFNLASGARIHAQCTVSQCLLSLKSEEWQEKGKGYGLLLLAFCKELPAAGVRRSSPPSSCPSQPPLTQLKRNLSTKICKPSYSSIQMLF